MVSETIALVKKKQKAFSLSVQNYKNLLKKGEVEVKDEVKKSKSKRGVVYLGHIPHGFYENEMRQYFEQFGTVTRLRLARSKKTGKSKGYAFIEFLVDEVAQIVAETMNNYLMDKRLLKAQYIPPEEQRDFFKGKNFTKDSYPTKFNRKKHIKIINAPKSKHKNIEIQKKMLQKINTVKNKLKEFGIDYDFQPVDVPECLKTTEENMQNTEDESDESEDDIIFNPPTPVKKLKEKKL